jgi:prepilin-type processing-associated H-X9-DG protein
VVREPRAVTLVPGIKLGTVRSAWIYTNADSLFPVFPHVAGGADLRAGSYAINAWLCNWQPEFDPLLKFDFLSENQIQHPSGTPVLSDGPHLFFEPEETSTPMTDLVSPWPSPPDTPGLWMIVAMPRHGSRPNPVPNYWPINRPLPGAINVSFYDGHGELVKLDNLWQLYWHKSWQPPLKRPGLP